MFCKLLWSLLIATGIIFYHSVIAQVPGVDYPNYATVPRGLAFSCRGKLPGYYADVETRCQVWHWCTLEGGHFSQLCPNHTVFNQAVRVCDWWYNVDCEKSVLLYGNNEDLYKVPRKSN